MRTIPGPGRFCQPIEPRPCYRCSLPDLRAVRALRRNVYPRHHKERGENCVEQDARAVGTPSHNLSPSSKGMHLVSGTYEESGASYVICVTLAQLKLFLPRRPRRSRRCDGHVIPNGRYGVRAERRATDRADGRGDESCATWR